MKPITCPNRADLSAFLLGKLPDDALLEIAEHSSQCAPCQKTLHDLDTVSDPLVAQLRQRRLQSIAPELAGLLAKAAAIGASHSAVTVPPENTLGGTPAKAEYAQVLAPPQRPDEIGRLGSYRVLKLLGQGGMGMVFQAEDPRLQRAIALKVMLPSLAANQAAKERFLREARAAAAIEHDHIVTIHQVDEDRGVPFIAMPFLKGISLEDYLKRAQQTKKPLTLGQILKLGREIARGLAAAHARGLIHRDIKPANIWLDATAGGRVKILDFGLARPAESDATLTQSGMIVGTPAYMAPEQATGQKIDGRADLFSLGCVLYRLCAGRLPWKGENAMATLMAIATEETTPLGQLKPDLPPALAALVMKLLAKKPEDRTKSAKAVVEAIVALEKEQAAVKVPVAALAQVAENQWQLSGQSETAALVKVRKPLQKRPRRWPLVAAAVLVLLGGSALLWQVIIRVKTKDGEVEVRVPTGSKVDIDRDGKVEVRIPDKGAGTGVAKGVDPAWIASVQKLPPEKQVEAVAEKLKERNPGFDGTVKPKIVAGAVTELGFVTDNVTDIAPVRALTHLRKVSCGGSWPDKGQLADLSPLRDMKLAELSCQYTQVSDLSPLKDMKLTALRCGRTHVADLSPLKDMKLTTLWVYVTHVSDLSPLKGMPLTHLNFDATPVSDLTPLKDMPLKELFFNSTKVTDLAPLKGMPLKEIKGPLKPERDAAILRSIKTLEIINEKPADEFLKQTAAADAAFEQWLKDTQKLPPEKQVEAVAAKLKELNPGFDGKVEPKIENGFGPVVAEGHEADETALRWHESGRFGAAQGHETDGPEVQLHKGGRPVAAQGHEGDVPELRCHEGIEPVATAE